MLTSADAKTFERCMSVGGVAVFPADTVYGLACDPQDKEAFRRMYALKGRVPDKPSAVLFFQTELALSALPELGERTAAAVRALVPGAVTLVLPNPARRFPLACGPTPEVLGLRVPALGAAAAALHEVRWPVVQSSANPSGGPDARRVADVDPRLREGVDLVLDAGELPGTPSTVIDLVAFEAQGSWRILRHGAVGEDVVAAALADA
ncbi:L-threonylcarbamoyladenylate synthase [Paraconexibacter sp.]|uniref:L-threonylcarbamoyladenylate synthase n=1 Tax=Paraconexibacter sp. TaxID=2949640 RepID=UPI003562B7A8